MEYLCPFASPSVRKKNLLTYVKVSNQATPKVFLALFENPILEMNSTYGATLKNLTLGFSPNLLTIHVRRPILGAKSQC